MPSWLFCKKSDAFQKAVSAYVSGLVPGPSAHQDVTKHFLVLRHTTAISEDE